CYGSGSENSNPDVIDESTLPDRQLQAARPMAECAESAAPFHTEEPPQTNGGSLDVELAELAEECLDESTQRAPSRYRPPVQKPPRKATGRPVDREAAPAASSHITLDIRVRLTLDRFGFCALTFLPGRTAELDDEVAVKLGTSSLGLVAQEDWYQDLS